MRNGARVVGDALGSSMQRLGSPTHLSYMAGKPPAAGTPPPGSFFASIPPSSRVAMRRRAGGATPFIYRNVEGAKDFFKQDELQPIGLHGRRVDKGAARAASRTRQRDEQNNVSACFSPPFGVRCVMLYRRLLYIPRGRVLYRRKVSSRAFALGEVWRSRLRASSGLV